MKKIFYTLSLFVIFLAACSAPANLMDYQTNDFKSLYNNAIDEEALTQATTFSRTDNGSTSISFNKKDAIQKIDYNFTSIDGKTSIKYTVNSENKYSNIQITDKNPMYSDFNGNQDAYFEAVKSVKYKTDEASIPDENKLTYEDAKKAADENINSTFSELGKLINTTVTDDGNKIISFNFDGGSGSFYPDYNFFSFTATENNRVLQFSVDPAKLPETEAKTLEDAKKLQPTDKDSTKDETSNDKKDDK